RLPHLEAATVGVGGLNPVSPPTGSGPSLGPLPGPPTGAALASRVGRARRAPAAARHAVPVSRAGGRADPPQHLPPARVGGRGRGVRRRCAGADLRPALASNALAAGVTVFELARVMGTSVRMIERHYGALLEARTWHRGKARRA